MIIVMTFHQNQRNVRFSIVVGAFFLALLKLFFPKKKIIIITKYQYLKRKKSLHLIALFSRRYLNKNNHLRNLKTYKDKKECQI